MAYKAMTKKASMSKSPKGSMANKSHMVPTKPMVTRGSKMMQTSMNADKKMVR